MLFLGKAEHLSLCIQYMCIHEWMPKNLMLGVHVTLQPDLHPIQAVGRWERVLKDLHATGNPRVISLPGLCSRTDVIEEER